MADTAAHLVDRVLPEVPVRQWVLTLPYPLRYRCAWNARLTSEGLQSFLRAPPLGAPSAELEALGDESSADLPWDEDPGFDFDQSPADDG